MSATSSPSPAPASDPQEPPLAPLEGGSETLIERESEPAEVPAPEATDVIAGRARLLLPELHRPAVEEAAPPPPAPPTYAELEHLLRDLA